MKKTFLYLYTAKYEQFGLVIVDAMAVGLPVYVQMLVEIEIILNMEEMGISFQSVVLKN